VASIQTAKTEADAHKAALDWVKLIQTDPKMVAGALSYLTDGKQSVDPSALATKGCANSKMKSAVNELVVALEASKVTPDQAPANANNSGVTTAGLVVAESAPGITGNLKAIKIVTPTGVTFWVMARCGNAVKPGHQPVPVKPPPSTPTPHQPTPTPTCTDTHLPIPPNGLCPKVGSEDVLVNPSVAPWKQGAGKNPPGTHPTDPASKPVDNPKTGCQSTCPGHTDPPPPVDSPPPTTEAPPSPIASDTPVPTAICTPAPGKPCLS
jgi:hypothetical protein